MAQTVRIDAAPRNSGELHISAWGGFGFLAEDLPAATYPSVLANDVAMPEMTGREVRAEIITKPSSGTFSLDDFGRISFSGAPDGNYAGTYGFYLDNGFQGIGNFTISVGSTGAVATVDADIADLTGQIVAATNSVVVAADLQGFTGQITALSRTQATIDADIAGLAGAVVAASAPVAVVLSNIDPLVGAISVHSAQSDDATFVSYIKLGRALWVGVPLQ